MTTRLRDKEFERILLIKPSALGDVIHTLPILVKLRKRYPQARIDWLLTPPIADLICHHPALSRVVLFDRRRYSRLEDPRDALDGLSRLVNEIRHGHYDLVIDLHGQLRSAALTALSGARIRIGFDRPRRKNHRSPRNLPREAYLHGWTGAREGAWFVYSHRIPIPTLEVHAVDRYLRLADMLGFDESPPDFHVPVPHEAVERVTEMLRHAGLGDRPYVVMAPGTQWETKHWTSEGFAQVARYWTERGWAVVLIGSLNEEPACRAVADACRSTSADAPPAVIDLAGQTTVSQLAALIQRAEICLTNDSGPMHLTVALDRPVVSIFGPTDPLWIGPYRRPQAVVRVDLPCSPCYLRRLSRCPYDHKCMKQVTAETVIDRMEQMLTQERVAALREEAHPSPAPSGPSEVVL